MGFISIIKSLLNNDVTSHSDKQVEPRRTRPNERHHECGLFRKRPADCSRQHCIAQRERDLRLWQQRGGGHKDGAAAYALQHFGARFGQAEGIQRQSYAIPTVGNSFEDVRKAVERFTEYVVFHPQNRFMLTAVGTDNGSYDVSQIAPFFRQAYAFGNVYMPRSFIKYVVHNPNVQ